MTIFFVSVAFALGMSATCSLLEATLLSYTPTQVASLESRRPRLGKLWRHFKDNIEQPIAVILIVNTTAHTVGATVAGAYFQEAFGFQSLVIFPIVFTYLMLQFTEILPKTLGVRYNGFIAPLIGPMLEVLIRVLRPLLWFIQLINRPFSGAEESGEDTTLKDIAALAASAPLMDPHQSRMIRAASEMESIRVRQIMTPRTEVTFLRASQPMEEILDVMKRCSFTRLPLCEEHIDNVIGMVHAKDLIKSLDLTSEPVPENEEASSEKVVHVIGAGTIDLMKIRRDVIFLPEHTKVLDALRRFQRARLHLAIVVDEYGSTIGIVTLEDVIEEMVGDIKDEFDLFAADLIRREGGGYRVNGRFPLHELVHHIPELAIDHAEEDADTIGGYVSQTTGHLPAAGESFVDGPYTWTVTSADTRRVREVLLTPIETPEDTPPEEKD